MTDATEPKDLQTTFEDVFDGLAFEGLSILYDRQRKYGPENIRQQGLWGIWQRIRADKMARIDRSFNGRIEHGQIVLELIRDDFGDETWEDTLFDISNLALIMIAVKRGVWGFPMREETGEVETLAAAHPDGVPQLTADEARAFLTGYRDEDGYPTVAEVDEDPLNEFLAPVPDEDRYSLPGRIATEADLDELKAFMDNRLEEARERADTI